MIDTLRRIASYAAKGIWLYIRAKGIATIKDIESAGFKPSVAFEALAELRACGYIIRILRRNFSVDPVEGNNKIPTRLESSSMDA